MLGKLANGGYAISSEIDIPGEGATNFIFGRGWLLEIIELAEGEYSFFSDGREVRPASERFAVFYPPFTFVRAYVNAIKERFGALEARHLTSACQKFRRCLRPSGQISWIR